MRTLRLRPIETLLVVVVESVSSLSGHVGLAWVRAGVERVHPFVDATITAWALGPFSPVGEISVRVHWDIFDIVAVIHCRRRILTEKASASRIGD